MIAFNRVVPRLSASYDLMGSNKMVLQGSYARYSRRSTTRSFRRTPWWGIPIATALCLLRAGRRRAGLCGRVRSANYAGAVYLATFPTINIKFDPKLSSPITDEFTAGVAGAFAKRSYAKAIYVQRKTGNFVGRLHRAPRKASCRWRSTASR